MRYLMIAETTPIEGRDDEFNDWYDNLHLKEVLATPGFVSAQRFKVASGEAPFQYYAIYEVEAASLDEILSAVAQLRGSMTPTDALDQSGSFILAPVGDRVTIGDFTSASAG